MALTGELDDLSLAELIEFFCNQRKTGCLKVIYADAAGYFYLKSGAVIHARFGDLSGIDAVYYALTQSNASFTFDAACEAPAHSINQPWTSLVLEGLRRMDEGVSPRKPSATGAEKVYEEINLRKPSANGAEKVHAEVSPLKLSANDAEKVHAEVHEDVRPQIVNVDLATAQISRAENSNRESTDAENDVRAFGVLLSASESNSFARRRWSPAMVIAAVVALVAVVGVPWGWYTHKKGARLASEASAATVPAPTPEATPGQIQSEVPAPQAEPSTSTDAAELAKRQREARARERAKALEQGAPNVGNNVDAPAKPVAANQGNTAPATSNKRATVQVTYDENGRVTAASGGDATALRIARQKRFPPGKPGSATITIPIN